MSHTWKVLPLAVFAALGAFILLPGGAAQPPVASAFDCTSRVALTIDIQNLDTSALLSTAGSQVAITPNPQDATQGGSLVYVDNGANDDDNTAGRIKESEACKTETGQQYTIILVATPATLSCQIEGGNTRTTGLTAAQTVVFFVRNCGTTTPTPTPTGTAGPAANITVTSSHTTLGCGNTSIITVTVKNAAGQAVAAGTLVNVSANMGTVSPSSGTTTADGSVFVFFTAPSNQGGTATVTATSGNASGNTNITVNCAQATATPQPPPPTSTPAPGTATVIAPPATGDGGLADGVAWQTYAGLGLVVASVLATLLLVRSRAG